jgi:hypothetical protein
LINENLYNQAVNVARTDNVDSLPDTVVLYSVSFLPTMENKDMAFRYMSENPSSMTIEKTECGRNLLKLGFDFDILPDEDKATAAEIWKIASSRFIKSASGNITAFVKNADKRSVFRSVELPEIMSNPAIRTINGIDKFDFIIQMGWQE